MSEGPMLEMIELKGAPRRMGEAFGEACRDQTWQLYERRLETAIGYARRLGGRDYAPSDVLALARRCLAYAERYDPVGHAEFLGIARGAQLEPEQLMLMQEQTDLHDVLAFGDVNAHAAVDHGGEGEGCSSFIVGPDRAMGGGVLLGQTWDLATNNEPYVRLVRRTPDEGPATVSLTLTGCLTLIGMNSEGLAVGTTNLHTTDGRAGLGYLHLIHRAIRCRTVEEAVPCFVDAPRAGSHYYFVADGAGRAAGLECSATRHARFDVQRGVFVHCNHALAHSIRALEAPFHRASTEHRQTRLSELLDTQRGCIDVDMLKRSLSDREGGDCAICRYNTTALDISTNAAVIMRPDSGELHACRAQPDRGVWRSVRVAGGG